MPNAPKRHCTYPGCATLVLGGRCARHPYPRKKRKRASSSEMGYDSAWRMIRAKYIRAHPVCEIQIKCRGAAAQHVDHVVPLTQGGTNGEQNLQAACHRCHSAKTARHDMARDGGRFSGPRRKTTDPG